MPEPGRIYQCHNKTEGRPRPSIFEEYELLTLHFSGSALIPQFSAKICDNLNLQNTNLKCQKTFCLAIYTWRE